MKPMRSIASILRFWMSPDILQLPSELIDVYRARVLNRLPGVIVRRIAEPGNVITNPSIIRYGDAFVIAARAVNYKLVGWRKRYEFSGGAENMNSQTWLYKYSLNLNSQGEPILLDDDEARKSMAAAKNGFEDPRLFVWRGGIWGIWTAGHIANGGQITYNTMVLGQIDQGILRQSILLSSPYKAQREKNWMPFVDGERLYFLYSLKYMEVYAFEDGKLVLTHKRSTPIRALEAYSGSSQLIPWAEGWICVSHYAATRGVRAFKIYPRYYPHQFILISKDFSIKAVSRNFFFTKKGIEFCAGLVIDGDRVLLSFGVDDSSSYLMEMSREKVMSLFENVDWSDG